MLLAFPMWLSAQNSALDSLHLIKDMPYICENLTMNFEGEMQVNRTGPGCGDPIFWRAVRTGKADIPTLIRKISDPTLTAATVPNFGGQYAVGDIAWTALSEIIHVLPTWELLGVPFDRWNCGYCAYWDHLRANPENRKAFSRATLRWYRKHRKMLTWVESQTFSTCDGCRNHPNGGHFSLPHE